MDKLLDGLNDAQRSAVTSPANVVQVLAPPGSGKTKTLTARVAFHVVHERLQPWNIIVCTFTIKAAREMKERIKGFVGDKLEAKLILGTFHSVARRFLSRYGQEIGIDKNFGIADTSDSTAILKRIITRYSYTVEPGHARSRIFNLKAKGVSADEYSATTKNANDNEFAMIYSSYEEHLRASNLLDYDDLLVRCVDLLKRCPSCVSTIQAVLIDEYQDTNNIQYELMKLLAQNKRRITIVGDPDQSIYSFRAAEIKNLLRMREDFPESIVINLENNYRSSGYILNSASAVIEKDESRPQKALVATHGIGERPTLRHLASPHVEARWIVEEITRTRTLSAGLLKLNDYAILVRSSSLSLQLERALAQAGIPYRMVAGLRFFDRAEIKIILDYLRVISQPEHNDAIARVINLPARKVGDATVKSLLEEAEVKKVTLWKLILDMSQGRRRPSCKISSQAQKGIDQFVDIILSSQKKMLSTDGVHSNLYELISHVLQKISFEAYLKQAHKDNWQDRWQNVEELVNQATQMATAMANGEEVTDDALPVVEGIEQRQDTAEDILSKFLANITLSSVADQEGAEAEQVTISTIHAAKGLEWPVVFMPAVYDGSIPHSRSDDHDEERRLLYVGMTRAQGLLYLSCPVKQSGQEQTTLSRFISDNDVQKFFSGRGPDLAFNNSALPDLARILGRACPSVADIDRARSELERLEDDKYPATREEIDGEDSSWGAAWDQNTNTGGAEDKHVQPSFKRRRLDKSTSSYGEGIAVTMNNTSGFSVASTSMQAGFTSALDLGNLQAMQQEAERIRMLATANYAEAGKEAYKESKKAEMKSNGPKKAKPRAAGQGAITSFFKTSGASLLEKSELPTAGMPSMRRAESSPAFSHPPLNDKSNLQAASIRPSKPFQSLTMSNYKPVNRPMATKPKRSETEPGVENPRYVLLSSSPAKPDADDSAPQSNEAKQSEPDSPVKPVASLTTASRSSTFHTTSMNQVQAQTAQRKTLGTRRTMQGWSVKHNSTPTPRQS